MFTKKVYWCVCGTTFVDVGCMRSVDAKKQPAVQSDLQDGKIGPRRVSALKRMVIWLNCQMSFTLPGGLNGTSCMFGRSFSFLNGWFCRFHVNLPGCMWVVFSNFISLCIVFCFMSYLYYWHDCFNCLSSILLMEEIVHLLECIIIKPCK